MALPNPPATEALRQQSILAYELNEPGTESAFDNLTELAADLFDVPIAVVTVLAPDHQHFRGACGIGGPGTDRESAFCNYTVEQRGVMVVENALTDPRFKANPLVTGDPHIRFYAGAPIRVGDDVAVGSFCLIDRTQRTLTEEQGQALVRLAQAAADIIELRIGSRVAERRKIALEQHAELLRATVDNVDQGIGLYDRDHRLIFSNALFQSLLAGEAEDLLGSAGGGEDAGTEARTDIVTAQGHILELFRARISDERQLVTIQDVTDRRRLAQMHNEFVSTVSHELRTPLTSIRGALALIGANAQVMDGRGQKLLDLAQRNSERLGKLINDILDIEKLGAGGLEFNMEPLDLRRVVAEAIELNRPYARSLDVSLEADEATEALPVVGDSGRLIQALTNLISNAAKFSSAGAKVEVVTRRDGGRITVRVIDHGEGIPVEFRPHLFKRFAQAAPQRQGNPGTGLGLAITKSIIEEHNGEIGFESQEGQGTQFRIALPLAPEQPN